MSYSKELQQSKKPPPPPFPTLLPHRLTKSLFLLGLLLLFDFCSAAHFSPKTLGEQDEITDELPGLGFELNFRHYSGYLQVSDNHFLHYWLVTSQNDPANDPLVFWFNGGPGCSSLDGLLKEMGPYMVNKNGRTLYKNPYAWNKNASVVYLESPAGVGYSYASDGNTLTDDIQTAAENYEALKQFFLKHPSFRNNSLFVSGESYAGIYVPSLCALIVDGQEEYPLKLKGMLVGNGYVNVDMDVDTSVRFAYGHGLVDEKMWQLLKLECCGGCIEECNLSDLKGFCGEKIEQIFEFIWHGGLNPYDLYRDCDSGSALNSPKFHSLKRGLTPKRMHKTLLPLSGENSKKEREKQPHKRSLFQSSPNEDDSGSEGDVPCLDDSDATRYLNMPEVRQALHIPKHLGNWTICNDEMNESYGIIYVDTAPFFKKILEANVRVLLYYGDTDMACNFLLGQQFASRLGYKVISDSQPWRVNGQIAGFKTRYAHGLTFITVRGSGHMVPEWRGPQIDYAFRQFLQAGYL